MSYALNPPGQKAKFEDRVSLIYWHNQW